MENRPRCFMCFNLLCGTFNLTTTKPYGSYRSLFWYKNISTQIFLYINSQTVILFRKNRDLYMTSNMLLSCIFNKTVFGISKAILLWNAFSIWRLSLVCMAAAPHKGPRQNMSKLLKVKDRSIPMIMACAPGNMEKHDDSMTWACIPH